MTHLTTLEVGRDPGTAERLTQAVEAAFPTNGALRSAAIFTAQRKWKVVAIREIHDTLGTDVGAVTVTVRKCTGVQAPGAGLALLTAAFNLKAAVNTQQVGALTATAADLELAVGDRLAVDFAGVLTAVAGVVVQIDLEPI